MTDYERDSNDDGRESTLPGLGLGMLLVGLGLGALFGIMLTPTTGKKARQFFRKRFEDARGLVTEQSAGLKERAKDLRSRGEDFTGEASSKFKKISRKFR